MGCANHVAKLSTFFERNKKSFWDVELEIVGCGRAEGNED